MAVLLGPAVGIFLLICAIFGFLVVKLGLVNDHNLQILANIGSVLALVAAAIAFIILPFQALPKPDPSPPSTSTQSHFGAPQTGGSVRATPKPSLSSLVPTLSSTPSQSYIKDIVFSLDWNNKTNEPIGVFDTFPLNLRYIVVSFDCYVPELTEFHYAWFLNGHAEPKSNLNSIVLDPEKCSKRFGVLITFDDPSVFNVEGNYAFQIYRNNQIVAYSNLGIKLAPFIGPITICESVYDQTNAPINPTSVLPRGTSTIHATFVFGNLKTERVITAELYREVESGKYELADGPEKLKGATLNNAVYRDHFEWNVSQDGYAWRAGKYKMDVLVDGNVLQSTTFEIK